MLLSASLAAAGRVHVFRAATVVDGTGAPRYVADVAVEGPRIVGIRRPGDEDRLDLPDGVIERDAAGLVLAPGLIDLRAQPENSGSAHGAAIRQGVTTAVLVPPEASPRAPATDGRLATIDAEAVAHVAVLVASSDLRAQVVGHASRTATVDEISEMQRMLAEALDAGAMGLRTEVPFAPAAHAGAELEALCRVVAERGGHWSLQFRESDGGALDTLREAREIGRRTGCRIHLGHATADAAPGRSSVDLHVLVEQARADGVDITSDTCPPGVDALARLLGRDGREQRALTLEQVVQRLSGAPAEILGLHRGDRPRGVIREGAAADLVLFDPDTIVSRTDDPGVPPTGVLEVLVSGMPVLSADGLTGAAPGRVLCMPPPPHRAVVPRTVHEIDPGSMPFVLRAGTAVHPQEGLEVVAGLLGSTLGLSAPDAALPALALRIDPEAGGSEAFRIRVGSSGIDVAGGSAEGVFRGTTVLRQLCDPEHPLGSRIPAGTWRGEPAFGWRGLMLDVARHFRPVDEVRRLIDLLAAHHLNVLHLHLTDDQGWRFEVPGYPRLTEVGAVRHATQLGHGPSATVEPGEHAGFYRSDEIRDLVAYAADRFVTIVPEVELPGHVQAALAAYPQLGNTDISEEPAGPWERFGVNRRVLAPTEESLAFGRAAIDALCELFDAEWIGIGGDEVPTEEWAASPAALDRMRELGLSSPQEVQPWFTRAFAAHVRARGRTALAWDEVLAGDVPEGVRLLAWRGPVAMSESLRRGIPVVACPDLEVYLDYPQSGSEDEPIRVGPPLPIERTYTLRVPDGAEGGQANVWSEHLPTRDRVDFAVFPRLSAIAERLWDGGEAPPFDDFARRLPVQLRRLAAAGVRYRPVDGPMPGQRRPGIPGKPLTLAQREAIVADLVAGLSAGHAARRGSGGSGSE